MARGRLDHFIQYNSAQYTASLVVRNAFDFIDYIEYHKEKYSELMKTDQFITFKYQLNEMWNDLYVELPDDAG